jgi:alpha/beta superfamily hydrolase
VPRRIESHDIAGPAGRLEAVLEEPEDGAPRIAALVCHPHPLFGGTLHNKVVYRIARGLRRSGAVVLRFNFRGVGHSTGTNDEGRGELDDARYALEFLSRRYPGVPAIIAGFSFGAYVGLNVAASDDRVQAMIGLGVPARMFGDNTLQESHKPKLFIHGTVDEVAPYDQAQQWFDLVPAPKRMIAVQGADHFFQGRLEEVQAIIADFVRSLGTFQQLPETL